MADTADRPLPGTEDPTAPELDSALGYALSLAAAWDGSDQLDGALTEDLTLRFADLVSTVEDRFALVAERADLDWGDQVVLGLIALADLAPEHALAVASTDPADRGHASARAMARLLVVRGAAEGETYRCVAADGALRRKGLVRALPAGPEVPLAARAFALTEPTAAFLLAADLHDPTRGGRLRRVGRSDLPVGRAATVEALEDALRTAAVTPLFVHGPDATLLLAEASGGGVTLIRARDLDDAALLRDALAVCVLEHRVLVVEGVEDLEPEQALALPEQLRAYPGTVVLGHTGRELAGLDDLAVRELRVPAPGPDDRRAAWTAGLGEVPGIDEVAQLHRLPVARIADAVQDVLAVVDRSGTLPDAALLARAARNASGARVDETARRTRTDLGWDDLVLPARPMGLLRSVSAFLRHREQVLDDWGFAAGSGRAHGVVAMFTGPSGTGKTLAARVIAAELGLELLRVDLSTLVSKWLGETERNLDRIFTAAEGSSAVLFFDEADAVFGKRAGVQDARDRYANLEVAYLLQRIEAHDGPVLLATNLRGNIDEAFLRRLDAVIEFPEPDEAGRRRLWEVLIPPGAPRHDDIDLDFLAARFELTGGGIRNAALAAAVMAAEAGGAIRMEHLVRGVAIEYAKLGRLVLVADFERFHETVRER